MAPLLECHATSGYHLQSFSFFPFGSINLGFLLRENLAAIFIIPSSWGSQLDGAFHYQHHAASSSFLVPLSGRKKKTSARGVSHAHPLLSFKFCFTLFLLASFYQKQKKLVSLIVVFTYLLLVLLEWLLRRTPSYVILLALIIVILSALLLRHLLLLQIFMRLSLLC
jgi:hypothetical protein